MMKYRVSLIIFLASAVIAQVPVPSKPDAPKPTGLVSGVVKNAANGEPLANITVCHDAAFGQPYLVHRNASSYG